MKQLTTKTLQGRSVFLLLLIFILGIWTNYAYASCDFSQGTITAAVSEACKGGSVTITHSGDSYANQKQWFSSIDGGVTWVPITGATGASYTASNIQQNT